MKPRLTVPIILIAIGCLIFGAWRSTSRQSEIQSHLSSLDFWERQQFGKSKPADLLRLQAWRGVLGTRPDAGKEAEREYQALMSLGYMTNCTFVLRSVITNAADHAAFVQRVRAAKFSEAHWQFSSRSNRIEAVTCVRDVPVWEEVIRSWEAQREGPQPGASGNR